MKKLSIAIATIAMCSCGKTSFNATTYKEYNPESKHDVIVYTDGRPVPKTATEIGEIRYKAGNIDKAVRRAKKEAARHGANALYAVKPMKDIAFAGSRGRFIAVNEKRQ